jgi:hypothetical protein
VRARPKVVGAWSSGTARERQAPSAFRDSAGDRASRDRSRRVDPARRLVRRASIQPKGFMMIRTVLSAGALCLALGGLAAADPIKLTDYADENGFLDVQALTCAQLANTYQEEADKLTAWYSGWYNGLAKKHMMDVGKMPEMEHEVIVYCKANQDKKIIEAIAEVLKDERMKLGIKMAE